MTRRKRRTVETGLWVGGSLDLPEVDLDKVSGGLLVLDSRVLLVPAASAGLAAVDSVFAVVVIVVDGVVELHVLLVGGDGVVLQLAHLERGLLGGLKALLQNYRLGGR